MLGEPIESVKNGIQVMVSALRQDPYALETAFLSIISFDSSAKQLVPLTELTSFRVPELQASGTTALGEALSLLARKIDSEVVKSSPEVKGDWKPLVFLMTDGEPTDNWQAGLAALKKVRTGMLIACAAGTAANSGILKQITEIVVRLDTADSATIKSFFKWVSASVSTGSQKIDNDLEDAATLKDLPPPPPEVNVVL
jgi:uncharacterized protein YegL